MAGQKQHTIRGILGYAKINWVGLANAAFARNLKKRKYKLWKKKHPKAAAVKQYLAADKDDRRSDTYWMWRRAVLKRDKFQCQRCCKKGVTLKLHTHHIKDWYNYPVLRFSVDNGMTLCGDCHILRFPFMNPKRFKELTTSYQKTNQRITILLRKNPL